MVADSDLPYFCDYSRQRGTGFGALAQTIGGTAIPFLRRYIVPAAKRVGADLIELAAPEIGNVLAGRKKFHSAATDVGNQKLHVNKYEVENLENDVLFENARQKSVIVELGGIFFPN